MGPMKAVNLILNPRFADNAKTWYPANYQATNDPTLSVRDVNLVINRTSDAGQQWAMSRFATKPGKEYVVAVVSVSFEGEFLNGRSVAVTNKQNTGVIGALGGVAHGMNSFRFTASDDEANLRLYASSGAETIWKEPMVVASDEWEWLQSGNIDYFDYSLMPDPRGGGVFLLAFLLMLSASLSGGWRHERADAGAQLVPGPVPDRHRQTLGGVERGMGVLGQSVSDAERQEPGRRLPLCGVPSHRPSVGDPGSVLRVHGRVQDHRGLQSADAPELAVRGSGSWRKCVGRDTDRDRGCHGPVRRCAVSAFLLDQEYRRSGHVFADHAHRGRYLRRSGPDRAGGRLGRRVRIQAHAQSAELMLGVVA